MKWNYLGDGTYQSNLYDLTIRESCTFTDYVTDYALTGAYITYIRGYGLAQYSIDSISETSNYFILDADDISWVYFVGTDDLRYTVEQLGVAADNTYDPAYLNVLIDAGS